MGEFIIYSYSYLSMRIMSDIPKSKMIKPWGGLSYHIRIFFWIYPKLNMLYCLHLPKVTFWDLLLKLFLSKNQLAVFRLKKEVSIYVNVVKKSVRWLFFVFFFYFKNYENFVSHQYEFYCVMSKPTMQCELAIFDSFTRRWNEDE